jgi:hypothetical protein
MLLNTQVFLSRVASVLYIYLLCSGSSVAQTELQELGRQGSSPAIEPQELGLCQALHHRQHVSELRIYVRP